VIGRDVDSGGCGDGDGGDISDCDGGNGDGGWRWYMCAPETMFMLTKYSNNLALGIVANIVHKAKVHTLTR
jgi:hypothetical protein